MTTHELNESHFARAIRHRTRVRILAGTVNGDDIAALRRFTGLTREAFTTAMGISARTLHAWEHGRRTPTGPALALLRITARHPRMLRENLSATAH